ncbi:hypothetical protein [[Mycobacterium] nativiensis]|uniref:Uncharacterized protein n=1 Tax=[Mycobacterium] nativiensis TaxID=2855503 RepID=A0ABU5XYJ9_9MYCO|nr:hypothetical protein [Mycolicibacter sp. MYC340]MEB3033076.1 hypothetical protein [Mycolicibacter sp. MYC340]
MTVTPPPWPTLPAAQPHRRSPVALVALAALLGVAALILAIVALTRPPASPTYSAAQRTAAQADLCDRFKPAMNAVHIETDGPDAGLGRIALPDGTLVLDDATANSALDPQYRDAARAVMLSYEDLVVVSSSGKAGDPQFDNVVNTANNKERLLKELCGG